MLRVVKRSVGSVGAEAVRFLAKKRGRLEGEIPAREKYDH